MYGNYNYFEADCSANVFYTWQPSVELSRLTAKDLLFIFDVAGWAVLAGDGRVEETLEVLQCKIFCEYQTHDVA